jgi:hypothetical protein
MRLPSTLFVILLLVSVCCSVDRAVAQQTPDQGDPASPKQWLSHQMNQPPPPQSDRFKISQDRIDEIQQLYESARKQREQKAKTQTKDAK